MEDIVHGLSSFQLTSGFAHIVSGPYFSLFRFVGSFAFFLTLYCSRSNTSFPIIGNFWWFTLVINGLSILFGIYFIITLMNRWHNWFKYFFTGKFLVKKNDTYSLKDKVFVLVFFSTIMILCLKISIPVWCESEFDSFEPSYGSYLIEWSDVLKQGFIMVSYIAYLVCFIFILKTWVISTYNGLKLYFDLPFILITVFFILFVLFSMLVGFLAYDFIFNSEQTITSPEFSHSPDNSESSVRSYTKAQLIHYHTGYLKAVFSLISSWVWAFIIFIVANNLVTHKDLFLQQFKNFPRVQEKLDIWLSNSYKRQQKLLVFVKYLLFIELLGCYWILKFLVNHPIV